MEMRCLTMTQPWATLAALDLKRLETRSWPPRYRGLLALHAGRGYADFTRSYLVDLCQTEPFCSALAQAGYHHFDELPRQAILAVTWLTGYWRITADNAPAEPERSFGNYTPGRWAWQLSGTRTLPKPLPVKGAHRLWRPPAAVRRQLLDFAGVGAGIKISR